MKEESGDVLLHFLSSAVSAINEFTFRGMSDSIKWIHDILPTHKLASSKLPGETFQVNICYGDISHKQYWALLEAKNHFQERRYLQASNCITSDMHSCPPALFLKCNALFLQSEVDLLEERKRSSLPYSPKRNHIAPSLYSILYPLYLSGNLDSASLFLYGKVLMNLEGCERDAVAVFLEALKACPYNWSAWDALLFLLKDYLFISDYIEGSSLIASTIATAQEKPYVYEGELSDFLLRIDFQLSKVDDDEKEEKWKERKNKGNGEKKGEEKRDDVRGEEERKGEEKKGDSGVDLSRVFRSSNSIEFAHALGLEDTIASRYAFIRFSLLVGNYVSGDHLIKEAKALDDMMQSKLSKALRADTFAALLDYDEAVAIYAEIISEDPFRTREMMEYAKICYSKGDAFKLSTLATLVNEHGKCPFASNIVMGLYNQIKKHYAAAHMNFKAATQLASNPYEIEISMSLFGLLLLDKGSPIESAHVFRHLLNLQPRNYIALTNLGMIYYNLNQFEMSRFYLLQSLKTGNGRKVVNNWIYLCECLHKENLKAEAYELLIRATGFCVNHVIPTKVLERLFQLSHGNYLRCHERVTDEKTNDFLSSLPLFSTPVRMDTSDKSFLRFLPTGGNGGNNKLLFMEDKYYTESVIWAMLYLFQEVCERSSIEKVGCKSLQLLQEKNMNTALRSISTDSHCIDFLFNSIYIINEWSPQYNRHEWVLSDTFQEAYKCIQLYMEKKIQIHHKSSSSRLTKKKEERRNINEEALTKLALSSILWNKLIEYQFHEKLEIHYSRNLKIIQSSPFTSYKELLKSIV